MSPFDISGRAYVITGGAGHLGTAICHGLARAGAQVLCLSSRLVDKALLDNLEQERIDARICDIADEEAFEAEVADFANRWDGLDGLVNNAVRAPRGIDLDMPAVEFDAGVAGVFRHYFTCSRSARRYMEGGGSIVNMTSMWGLVSPDPAVYLDLNNEPSLAMPASAGGILGLTRYLAVLLAEDNIRVNALVPGWFPKKRGPDRMDYMAEIFSRVPMRRIGKPEEIVGSVIYLLSDASSYMTGQQLVVDGGYSIK